jgi:hypothetical protein
MRRKLWSMGLLALMVTQIGYAELPSGNGWHAIPNTRLRPLCAGENGFSQILGAWGCEAITGAWNGAVFDSSRNRLVIWGGGHNDYYGNEMYAFNLDTQTVERLTNPGLPGAPSAPCNPAIANNTQPNSRHTYDGIEYMPNVDKMFAFGGSLACAVGNFGSDTWTFDFKTKTWKRMNPTGPIPTGDAGMMTAYDPASGLIYLHDRNYLYSYDVNADRYTRIGSTQVIFGYTMAGTLDPKRKKFVIAGWDTVESAGRVYTYDITTGAMQTLSTSGGSPVVNAAYPGLEYDPVSDRIVAWTGDSRNNVYSLNLDTRVWTATTFSGGPVPLANGAHSRWRYSPKSGVFVLPNDVDDNIYILRLSATTAAKPNPPTAVSVQ